MSKIFVVVGCLISVFPAVADNFVWTYVDPVYHDMWDGSGTAPAGALVGISDISYKYDLHTRQLVIHQTEWLSDGAGNGYAAPYDATMQYSLDVADLATTFDYDENIESVLDSFHQQAINDVNVAKNNLMNTLNINNIDSASSTAITNQILDTIFNDNNVSADTVYSQLNYHLFSIKNIGDVSSFAMSETGNLADTNNGVATNLADAVMNLDDAIGNRSSLVGAHIASGESVAMNLQSLNDGIESERQNRIIGDAFTLSAAKSYTDERVDRLDRELSAGIASALALSSVASSGIKEGKMAFSGGYGYYNGQSAGAFGIALGIKDNWSVHAGAGISESNVSFRAGTSYEITLW